MPLRFLELRTVQLGGCLVAGEQELRYLAEDVRPTSSQQKDPHEIEPASWPLGRDVTRELRPDQWDVVVLPRDQNASSPCLAAKALS